jgi:DNA-binding transcriptional regulator YiaG
MSTEEKLFELVDELLAGEPVLPPPAERARLREAAGVTQARLARALESTVRTVKNWEAGASEPRPPRRRAYVRLLEGWAAKYPAAAQAVTAVQVPPSLPAVSAPASRPSGPVEAAAGAFGPVAFAGDAAQDGSPAVAAAAPTGALSVRADRPETTSPARRSSTSGRPARKAAVAVVDPRFPNGPLVVLDGDGSAYCAGGIVLRCPATTVPELVRWALAEAGLGGARLNRHGQEQDPLVVLTAAACERLGMPLDLDAFDGGRSRRLPEDHAVVRQVLRAKWKLTQAGFNPWARVYRPAEGSRRNCVQLAVLPWGALDARDWGKPFAAQAVDGTAHPAEIARVLGVYAARVITPRGGGATCGTALMEAVRPPTRAVKDEQSGEWVKGHNPGSLGTRPVDPAPPEAVPEHPVAQGWEKGFVNEEAFSWVRAAALLSDAECLQPYAVGLDLNTAFLAASAGLKVGLGAPAYRVGPVFDKKTPGCWLVDLSHIELDPRLPSPFTPTGERPTGPAWYSTPTVAYAEELGYEVRPSEAFVYVETGAYLDPWHDRLTDAVAATLADLGVTPDLDEHRFLAAMAAAGQLDPGLAAALTAMKATVKGGIGKLRERPQGRHYQDGERWPALERPLWRSHIRAMLISKSRVNMHRKLKNMAEATGAFPLAVNTDCVVYASPGASPLDILPRTPGGEPLPGTFRLGSTPGLVKLEGVQSMLWAVDVIEQGHNPARYIKGDGHDAALEGE